MTATTAVRSPEAVRVRDSRTFRRLGLVAILPLGPLALTILRGVLPYPMSDNNADMVSAITADPAAQTIVVWMGFLALFTLPPAVLALGRLASRRAPILGTSALVIAGAAYLSLFWWAASDVIALTAVQGGSDAATITRVLDLYFADPTVAGSLGLYVLGHIIGTVLLGLALWRAGILPAWAGIVLAASQPVHLVSVILGSRLFDAAAWGTATAMFALAAVAVARMPNDDFDLAPPAAG